MTDEVIVGQRPEQLAVGTASDHEAETRAAPMESEGAGGVTFYSGRSAVRRGSRAIINAYRENPGIRRVVARISQEFASLTWRLYARISGPGGKAVSPRGLQLAPAGSRRAEIRKLAKSNELVEIPEHLFLDMMGKPNPWHTSHQARRLTNTCLDVVGEVGWALSLNDEGRPIGYYPVPPSWITEIPDLAKPRDKQTFTISVGGRQFKIKAEAFVWFRDVDPAEPYGRGAGVGMALGDEMDADEQAARYLSAFFANSARPDMIVSIEGAKREDLEAAKAAYMNRNRGPERAGGQFWHTGKTKVDKIQASHEEMQLLELRSWARDFFAQVWGVPPEILGMVESSNRATAQQARRIMAESVLVPRAEDFRERVQLDVLARYDVNLILDYDNPVPDDQETRLELAKVLPWVPTVGELREIGGWPTRGPVDDIHMLPFNLYPVSTPAGATSTPEAAVLAAQIQGRAVGKRIAEPDVETLLEELKPERLRQELRPLWSEEFNQWGRRETKRVGLKPSSFDMLNPRVVRHMANFLGARIADINRTTREDLRAQMIEGVREGEGVRELEKRVVAVFDKATGYRARMIARTETVRSSSAASIEAYQQSGIVPRKEWLVTPDGERHDDAGYGGVIAEIADDFVFEDGETAPHPGGFGKPEQDINCRCAVAGIVEETRTTPLERAEADAEWRVYEARRRDWEDKADDAFSEGFRAQRNAVLAAMEKRA